MTKASQQLFMSQSAVSQYIRSLEYEFGATLLIRKKNGLVLTEEGELLLDFVNKQYNDELNIRKLIHKEYDSVTLRIGSNHSFGEHILLDVIKAIRLRYPDIHFKLYIRNSEHLHRLWEERKVEFVIDEIPFSEANTQASLLYTDNLALVCKQDYPISDVVTFNDIAFQPWITRENGSSVRDELNQLFTEHKKAPSILLESASYKAIIEFVCEGLGLSLLSANIIHQQLSEGILRQLSLDEKRFERSIFLMHEPEKKLSLFQRDVINILSDTLQQRAAKYL